MAFLDFKMKAAKALMVLVLITFGLGFVKLIMWVFAGWE